MPAPSSERAGIRAVIRALVADGWKLSHVFDSAEDVPVKGEREAIEVIFSTGVGRLHVVKVETVNGLDVQTDDGWAFFVLQGDDSAADEVLNDYTTNLTAVEALTDTWY